jgi:hypothetical protein
MDLIDFFTNEIGPFNQAKCGANNLPKEGEVDTLPLN